MVESTATIPKVPNNRNLSNSEIDKYINELNDIIISGIEKSTPKYKQINYLSKISNTIIKKLHAEKSKLLTVLKHHNRLEHTLPNQTINTIKTKIKLIKKLIDEQFALAINKQFKDRFSKLNPRESSNMFREIKKCTKKNNQINLQYIQLEQHFEHILRRSGINPNHVERNESNEFIIRDKIKILDVIGAYIESFHSQKVTNNENNTHNQVTNYFNNFLYLKNEYERTQIHIVEFNAQLLSNNLNELQTKNIFVTLDQIVYIFRQLRGKHSSGIDTIPNLILKNLPLSVISQYCSLFNNMINNAYFPKCWKTAKVILLPKKNKNMCEPKNIRAISLLPNISKVFEICINNIFSNIFMENNAVCERQFGFKHKHSTLNAINTLTSHINWNWNKGYCTGACFIDMEKAFDSIWIHGLLFKLDRLNIPNWLIILIYNMINERKFIVCNGGNISTNVYSIQNGLQQGTVTAPMLFNIYLLDLVEKIETMISFADDIVIFHSDNKIVNINDKLQQQFDTVENYTTDWMLKINIKKCESILFRPPVNKCNSDIRKNWKNFAIKSKSLNTSIETKKVVKYLGIHLDNFLYFNVHIKETIRKATQAYFIYRNLFQSKFITKKVKIIMYQSLIRPIISYGCPIWFNISPSVMEKIRIFERKCLRSCTSLYRTTESNYEKYFRNNTLYQKANIVRIDNFIINIIRNHILRCIDCDNNNLIKAPYLTSDSYLLYTMSKGYVPPEVFIALDKKKYIQNERGIPVFYHLNRRATDKAIHLESLNPNNCGFDTSISDKDYKLSKKSNKFWWLC